MTETEAKELIIDGMNYAAYKETGVSLHDCDKNVLFGSFHYRSGRVTGEPSPWGEGDEFEVRMAELLRWAIQLGATHGNYAEALQVLRHGDHFINAIIKRARVIL